jgi:mRNA interferase RelE/StbE
MPLSEDRRYRVQLKKPVHKVLSRLPKDLLRRIAAAIDALALDPRPSGCKKLAGKYDHFRVRVGDWRIIYTIEDDVLVVTVVEIAPRGDAYRHL